ncbi:MAG: hypothetical protein R3C02_25685 [Planctomycetaceae bacterium]
MTDASDIPLACRIAAAHENEVNLIEPLLDRSVVDEAFWPSTHLLYDKAADSDPLPRSRLQDSSSNWSVRTATTAPASTQDEDKLKHYRDRWLGSNARSAGCHRFRRLVVRYERHDDLFLGFLQLACLFTTIQWL